MLRKVLIPEATNWGKLTSRQRDSQTCYRKLRTQQPSTLNMCVRLRTLVSRLLLLALLFTQFAVAAYACPKLSSHDVSASSAMPIVVDAAGCDEMKSRPSTLCFEHCFVRDQGPGHVESPAIPLTVLSARFIVLPDISSLRASGFSEHSDGIAPAASPPHTVLHCCFRI